MNISENPPVIDEQSFLFLPDSQTLIKEAWNIYRKKIFFYTLVSLPLILGAKVLFDMVLELQRTGFTLELTEGIDRIMKHSFGVLVLYFLLHAFLRNLIFLHLHIHKGFIQTFILNLKKLPLTVLMSFSSDNEFADIIALLENKNFSQAMAKNREFIHYFGKEVNQNLKGMNLLFGLTIVSFIPLFYGYIMTDNKLFLLVFTLFTFNLLISFILKTISKYLIYTHMNKYYKEDKLSPAVTEGRTELVVVDDFSKLDFFMAKVFGGRLTRRGFWVGNCIIAASVIIVSGFSLTIFSESSIYSWLGGYPKVIVGPIAFLPFLTLAVIDGFSIFFGVGFFVRRCHDLNMSGWNCLKILIPVYGLFVLVQLAIRKSSTTDNRYGLHKREQSIREIIGI